MQEKANATRNRKKGENGISEDDGDITNTFYLQLCDFMTLGKSLN